jgi:hypothetical protein
MFEIVTSPIDISNENTYTPLMGITDRLGEMVRNMRFPVYHERYEPSHVGLVDAVRNLETRKQGVLVDFLAHKTGDTIDATEKRLSTLQAAGAITIIDNRVRITPTPKKSR